MKSCIKTKRSLTKTLSMLFRKLGFSDAGLAPLHADTKQAATARKANKLGIFMVLDVNCDRSLRSALLANTA